MSRKLVAYFSASGVTVKLAETLAEAIGADIFEIRPEIPYSRADLDYNGPPVKTTDRKKCVNQDLPNLTLSRPEPPLSDKRRVSRRAAV